MIEVWFRVYVGGKREEQDFYQSRMGNAYCIFITTIIIYITTIRACASFRAFQQLAETNSLGRKNSRSYCTCCAHARAAHKLQAHSNPRQTTRSTTGVRAVSSLFPSLAVIFSSQSSPSPSPDALNSVEISFEKNSEENSSFDRFRSFLP